MWRPCKQHVGCLPCASTRSPGSTWCPSSTRCSADAAGDGTEEPGEHPGGGTWVGDDPSHCQPWANSRGKGYAAGGIEQPLAGKCFIPSLSKTHLQTASFHATAPGPSASSSRTWRGVLGKSSQAFVHPVKLEGYLFLLPAVWFLSGGCTSRRDHLPPAGSKRSDGQGSVAETLVPAQDIPAKIRIRSGRQSPPGSAWDSGAGREGPCPYSASRELQHPAVIPSPL